MSWDVVFMDVIPMRVDCPTCSESASIGTTDLSVFDLSQKQGKNSLPVTSLGELETGDLRSVLSQPDLFASVACEELIPERGERVQFR
jgi:hypothetical protein